MTQEEADGEVDREVDREVISDTPVREDDMETEEEEERLMDTSVFEFQTQRFIAHVPIPSQKEIQEALLNRRKMQLLKQFIPEDV